MSDDQLYSVTAGELRQFIEQAEQIEAEIADTKERLKETFAEAAP